MTRQPQAASEMRRGTSASLPPVSGCASQNATPTGNDHSTTTARPSTQMSPPAIIDGRSPIVAIHGSSASLAKRKMPTTTAARANMRTASAVTITVASTYWIASQLRSASAPAYTRSPAPVGAR